MSEYSRALGDTVRAARKKMGLSQNKVAALIDADERTIMIIELIMQIQQWMFCIR